MSQGTHTRCHLDSCTEEVPMLFDWLSDTQSDTQLHPGVGVRCVVLGKRRSGLHTRIARHLEPYEKKP